MKKADWRMPISCELQPSDTLLHHELLLVLPGLRCSLPYSPVHKFLLCYKSKQGIVLGAEARGPLGAVGTHTSTFQWKQQDVCLHGQKFLVLS